jgi:hypothetical protein
LKKRLLLFSLMPAFFCASITFSADIGTKCSSSIPDKPVIQDIPFFENGINFELEKYTNNELKGFVITYYIEYFPSDGDIDGFKQKFASNRFEYWQFIPSDEKREDPYDEWIAGEDWTVNLKIFKDIYSEGHFTDPPENVGYEYREMVFHDREKEHLYANGLHCLKSISKSFCKIELFIRPYYSPEEEYEHRLKMYKENAEREQEYLNEQNQK